MSENESSMSDATGPGAPNTAAAGSGDPAASAETISQAQLNDLLAKAAKADDNWERLVRLTADFDNYKKRAARERQDAIKYANEAMLERLVPVLDNFDMALVAVNNAQAGGMDSLKAGVTMIYGQLRSAVQEAGLEEIDAAGKTFDPNFHEAVSQQETTEIPEGQVVQQLRKGYKLRDRLVRPATVVVARKPTA